MLLVPKLAKNIDKFQEISIPEPQPLGLTLCNNFLDIAEVPLLGIGTC